MTRDEFRAALAQVGIAPEVEELEDMYAAWQRMESGHLMVLRRDATAGAG
ncbi:MAG: hypothetical protein O3A96_03185 [Proteobacteria bacterium]|nr:hypothetical protein [Pseudomonadota bacterium]